MKILIVLAAAALTVGCAGPQLPVAEKAVPKGDAFSKALHAEYVDLSRAEYAEGDYVDSDHFANRAISAAAGAPAQPEPVSFRKQGEKEAAALEAARKRLVAALAGDAPKRRPADSARAQAGYECWAQELEENFQPDDIDACRIRFFIALAAMEQKPPPPPKPKPSPLTFLVYFNTGESGLDAAATSVAETAAGVIAASKPSIVSVVGHADRAGGEGYNMGLSESRANMVADALAKAGVASGLLSISALGEHAPAVPTADGVSESGNRRVEIGLRY